MRFLVGLALLTYLAVLGAHPIVIPTPLVGHDLSTSFFGQDDDLDDDVLSAACLHNHTFDDGLQNFDQSKSPSLAYRPVVARFLATAAPAADRLQDGGLFRPPRA